MECPRRTGGLDDRPATASDGKRGPRTRLRVLGGFELYLDGAFVGVPQHSQRVLAFLAVQERPLPRSRVAFSLWPDTSEDRARASLRTALWKVKEFSLVRSSDRHLSLVPEVEVDLHHLLTEARQLVQGEPAHLVRTDVEWLTGDLLPDWEEDWLTFERERLRQLRLHALERLSSRLSAQGRHAEAVDAAHTAVAAEPLRESAQTVLICAHLREGNVCEARRQFEFFRRLLDESLGEAPPESLRRLVYAGRSDPATGLKTAR